MQLKAAKIIKREDSASYRTGVALADISLRQRFDREATSPCLKEYGWEKGSQGCVRAKAFGGGDNRNAQYAMLATAALAAAGVSVISKNKGLKVAAGASAALLGATALALPLVELSQVNKQKSDAPRIPAEGVSKETLMSYNDKFEKGDLVRQKFKLPNGMDAFHYGVYLGPDSKTKEPRMIHINPRPEDGSTAIRITGMKPEDSKNAWEYEKASAAKSAKNVDIDARVEALKPYIGKRIDYNIFDKNCETLARAIAGNDNSTYQTADMSTVGKALGRTLFGSPISIAVNKGQKAEVTYKEIESILNKQLRDAEKSQGKRTRTDSKSSYKQDPPWMAFLNKKGSTAIVKSPTEALILAKRFPQEELQVQIIKAYFLFLAAASYVKEGGEDGSS